LCSIAQDGTRNTVKTSPLITGKIMLIPFEPKLYMSEIDKKVNEQTNWNFNQIRENFRHQLDEQLQLKLKRYSSCVSFYADSSRMAKDLQYIYTSTHLAFDPLNKPSSSASKASKTSGIKDGQLAVEMSTEKKFTNILLSNNELLPYLNKKYKADYFIFINQLDIKNDRDSYNITTNTFLRKVDVHYTILDKTGKLIIAGLASSGFSSKENNPKKIVAQSFSPVATYIVTKFTAVINPSTEKK
jgi:hypothetical protein